MNELKIFGQKIKPTSVRTLAQMQKVIYDKKWLQKEKPALSTPLYYMYREVIKNQEDKKISQEYKIRYDITVMPPFMLGREFVKTKGHYHPLVTEKFTYPELYEVLAGEAIFLLQKKKDKKEIIDDVVAINRKQGEKLLVPPNYGHIIINPKDKKLITANLVSSKFSSLYREIEEMNGFCYFALKNSSEIKWEKNPRYKSVPFLRFTNQGIPLGSKIYKTKHIYDLINTPSSLDFLNNPQDYLDLWEK